MCLQQSEVGGECKCKFANGCTRRVELEQVAKNAGRDRACPNEINMPIKGRVKACFVSTYHPIDTAIIK
jgi:hypothetical protein